MNQDVEGVVDNARLRGAKVLQQMKVRPAIGTEGHQLSINHGVIRKIPVRRSRCTETSLARHISPAGNKA